MSKKLPSVDAVMVGVGWTGGILAAELTRAGLSVVGLERGQSRDANVEFAFPHIRDELKYGIRFGLMQDVSRDTLTFRNSADQMALPMRQLGSFLLGNGTGGAGAHWNGQTWRWTPYDFEIYSQTVKRYGKGAIDDGMLIQDWGVTYQELEPFFDKFEHTAGIGGTAGNLQGKVQAGGNPFEGPRARAYPNPPMKRSQLGDLFQNATQNLGYHPFPGPSANMTQAYTNPDGQALGACMYCGFCERFGCDYNAKASPNNTVLPTALATGKFEVRHDANVVRVNMDSSKKRAVSVTYVDLITGEEIEQPAEMIFLTSFTFGNVKLLMVSGIGDIYDPVTNKGIVGRNYTYQLSAGAGGTITGKDFKVFAGAGSESVVIDDFNGDHFDHTGLGFLHGGSISASSTGARPIQSNPGGSGWGSAWKKAAAAAYNTSVGIGAQVASLPFRQNHLDLDPTYRDAYGHPLVRMTFDYRGNERKRSQYLAEVNVKILTEMGAKNVAGRSVPEHYTIVPYQSTHNQGGAIMGMDPANSVVNPYMQHHQVSNLFVVGASSFPHNSGFNPTGTVGAVTYRLADAIVKRYIKAPGPLT
ncbi:GMC family oxidoreductase [Deinococcus marmoris]|uniref:Gluconate 2-dehydrogenase, membrane-bound, flavoprotein n=1 Tax=Deinococcus marmoris TaxID=249408 RepID=A0A1U7NS08_9DEIO|nr:GMC family oxidoreductase [Deinococcus marmoris]OLV15701.1 Gluconate 2-dehydrogenase, membrane-bound, flavoprotein [Deinococcus marmoris]